MQLTIPDKLYKIIQKVVKPDEFTPTLEAWIQAVIEDATEDCVHTVGDNDTQLEWFDYCQEQTEPKIKDLLDKVL